ncbi:hypothetical protein R3P38DRAFT_3332065 [Favolaschia claudopus]|uniref:Cyclase n=1 Tax=Favolaschia claudopus TaxID=2862362 RepID=A0AAV9ZQ24_9AGAR
MSTFVALAFIVGTAVVADARPTPHPLTLVSRAFDDSDIYANWPTIRPTSASSIGENDELGALNHIRNSTILAAKSEIQLGRAINLNLELSMPDPPLILLGGPSSMRYVITLNTQISMQFDGLKHFPYSTNASQATYQFYNDLIKFDDIVTPESTPGTLKLGIQNAAQKGIAGRGVLLDWAGWMASKNATFVFSETRIPPSDLDAVAACQGLNASTFFNPGDFLVLRIGFTKHDMLRWLWEKKLSLVGSDNPAFESLPNLPGEVIDGEMRSLHQVFIGGWGMSIVEFLNLEELAQTCHELGRYSFFFTIQNLNIPGGIASPPNAMAIV